MENTHTYIAIDLKSFYAAVECVERHLDPLTTHLVVADRSRTNKTICLAVSPSLKALGISGRPRLFEVEHRLNEIHRQTGRKVEYITAVPRMRLYMEYSAKIYFMLMIHTIVFDIQRIDSLRKNIRSLEHSYFIQLAMLGHRTLQIFLVPTEKP